MFGSLLQRPLVAADAQDRYPLLVSMMDRELDCCKLLFNKHIQTAEELGESRSNADSLHNAIVIYLTEKRENNLKIHMMIVFITLFL